jgi:Protein of unknown function (DUF3558)
MTMNRNRVRLPCLVALTAIVSTLTACGGGSEPAAAPGSAERPLVAVQTRLGGAASDGRSNEAAASAAQPKPGYDTLLKQQSRHPRTRFSPCNLVTATQARAIIGAPLQAPIEALQGPTCVYRSRDGKSFVTVAVQVLDFDKLRPRLRLRHRVEVSSRTAYCATNGQPMLYVPLSHGRVLSVAAHCAVAKQFAIRAVRQL